MAREPQLGDISGWGLFVRGVRVNLTKEQMQKIFTDLELEVVNKAGARSYVRAVPKKKGLEPVAAGETQNNRN